MVEAPLCDSTLADHRPGHIGVGADSPRPSGGAVLVPPPSPGASAVPGLGRDHRRSELAVGRPPRGERSRTGAARRAPDGVRRRRRRSGASRDDVARGRQRRRSRASCPETGPSPTTPTDASRPPWSRPPQPRLPRHRAVGTGSGDTPPGGARPRPDHIASRSGPVLDPGRPARGGRRHLSRQSAHARGSADGPAGGTSKPPSRPRSMTTCTADRRAPDAACSVRPRAARRPRPVGSRRRGQKHRAWTRPRIGGHRRPRRGEARRRGRGGPGARRQQRVLRRR